MTTPAATTSSYDSIADWYEDWLGGSSDDATGDPFCTPLLDLVGDPAGLKICDLACGQGRVSRRLARLGADVVGVDASAELLKIAGRYPTDARIQYRHDSAHTLGSCPGGEFDGVVCNMALSDIPDLGATINSAFRVLRPGGWFAFTAFHPCFNAPLSGEFTDEAGRWHRTVTGYFAEGFWQSDQRGGPPAKIGAHHRTLSTFLNTLIDAGFTLRRVRELTGPASSGRWQEVPAVLAVIVDKPQADPELGSNAD